MNKPREINAYQDYINTLPPISSYFDYNAANRQIKEQEQGEQRPQLYQAPVEQGFDYNKANAEIADQKANPAVRPTPDQIMEDFYKLPEPKYDQARQDRLKKLAKVNALGEGLKAVGDIFSLSQGAIVNRRQDDGKNERLYGMFQGYEDEYSRRLDQHNRDEFNLKLQQLREKRQDKWREEDMNFRRSESLRSQYNTDRQFNAMELDRDERRKDREQSRELQKENMERMEKQFEKQHGLAWAQLNWQQKKSMMDHAMKVQQEGNKNSFRLYTSDGKEIARIDQKGGVDKLLDVILSDTAAGKEIDTLKAEFGEGLSPEIKRYLVGKYWEKSPAAIKWLEGYSNLDANTIGPVTVDKLRDMSRGVSSRPEEYPLPKSPQSNSKALDKLSEKKKSQYTTGGYY